jgi:hypothetical protein
MREPSVQEHLSAEAVRPPITEIASFMREHLGQGKTAPAARAFLALERSQ